MVKGITYILNTDATFQNRVGTNVSGSKYKAYPCIAPETETHPFSIVKMTNRQLQHKGRATFNGEFTVVSYHKNYDQVDELDDAVIEALVPIRGTYNGINFGYIEYQNTSDDFVDVNGGLYVRTSTFTFSYTKTALT